jgi:hypothetical protein
MASYHRVILSVKKSKGSNHQKDFFPQWRPAERGIPACEIQIGQEPGRQAFPGRSLGTRKNSTETRPCHESIMVSAEIPVW